MVPLPRFYSGRLIAAGRILAGLTQKELAERARISVSTLKRYESGGLAEPLHNNWLAVVDALEAAGIEFVPDRDGWQGVQIAQQESTRTSE